MVLLICPTLTILNVENCNYQEVQELIEFAETLPVEGLVLYFDEYDYIRSR